MNATTSRLVKPGCLYALLAISTLIVAGPGNATADGTNPKDAQSRPVSPADVTPGANKATQGSSSFTPKPPAPQSADTATGGKDKQK
jgi:hypothetical protein